MGGRMNEIGTKVEGFAAEHKQSRSSCRLKESKLLTSAGISARRQQWTVVSLGSSEQLTRSSLSDRGRCITTWAVLIIQLDSLFT